MLRKKRIEIKKSQKKKSERRIKKEDSKWPRRPSRCCKKFWLEPQGGKGNFSFKIFDYFIIRLTN